MSFSFARGCVFEPSAQESGIIHLVANNSLVMFPTTEESSSGDRVSDGTTVVQRRLRQWWEDLYSTPPPHPATPPQGYHRKREENKAGNTGLESSELHLPWQEPGDGRPRDLTQLLAEGGNWIVNGLMGRQRTRPKLRGKQSNFFPRKDAEFQRVERGGGRCEHPRHLKGRWTNGCSRRRQRSLTRAWCRSRQESGTSTITSESQTGLFILVNA